MTTGPTTILVTGGAGFIGGAFVRQLLGETTDRVVNLDKLTYAGNLDSLASAARHPRHVFVQGDIGDGKLVARLLDAYQPDRVVNFAAESHVDRSIDGPRPFVETNVLGTFELLQAVRGYWEKLSGERRERFRMLHVSTDEVYGSLGPGGRFSETTPYSPNSPYSASKAASDHFVRSFQHTFGLPVLTTNCSNNYGPFQFPEKLIPLMVLNALEGKPLPVYGDGQHVRDWLFVDDHCRAIRTVFELGRVGEVYNIGGNSERTNLEIVHTICATLDRLRPGLAHSPCESLIRFVTDRPGHDRRYAIDAGKIERELGWRPSVSFEEGIERTVRWYLENPAWVERVQSGGYRRERLGLSVDGSRSSAAAFSAAIPSSDGAHAKHQAVRAAAGLGRNAAGGRSSAAAVAAVDYVEGPIHDVVFRPLKRFTDSRGWLTELYREDEVDAAFHPVMAYVSQTEPLVARGPHEHVDQADYFAFIGPGDFRVYLWDARPDSPTFGNKLSRVVGESDAQAVIIPPGVVHAYQNVCAGPGWVFNAPNRLYAGRGKKQPVDEIRHEECEGSPFVI